MKNRGLLLLLFLAGCLAFTGCARRYVVRMTNGARITAAGKPKLEKGFYVFKDTRGNEMYVSQGRVLEIAPASRSRDEKSFFKP